MPPLSGCSIQRKISAVISTEAAQGAMIAQRAKRRPGKRWLNSAARPRDSSIVMATTDATQISVRSRMPGRFGLSKTWLKLPQPAEPMSMPSGVMFRNDVWIMVTIGQMTTKPMSAIAGPSQASGSSLARRRRGDRTGLPARTGSADCASAVAMSDMCLSLARVQYSVSLTHGCITTVRRRAVARAGPSWDRNYQLLLLVAVCWMVPRTCDGLPVMAAPTLVLIWLPTVVQLAFGG